jgi:hypothetical protein
MRLPRSLLLQRQLLSCRGCWYSSSICWLQHMLLMLLRQHVWVLRLLQVLLLGWLLSCSWEPLGLVW